MGYKQITDALAGGADPSMLCATCPWDRYCITAPSMTAQEVEDACEKARVEDEAKMREAEARGEKAGMPFGSLLTGLTLGGRDKQAEICPVFALRLRSSAGRSIVDGLKSQMVGWDDES